MMKPPIVIVESEDISVHPTADHVESFLEIVDVQDGIYTAYDSEGYLLKLEVEKKKQECKFLMFTWTTIQDGVVLSEVEPRVNHSTILREMLICSLHHRRFSKENIQDLALPSLIQKLAESMPWRIS